MYALASNIVSVVRGTTTNTWGDVVDNPPGSRVVVATGVRAQIVVDSVRSYDPTSQTIRSIQQINGAVASNTNLLESDQLVDEQNGTTWIVEQVYQRGGPGFVGDLELVLRRVL